MDDPIDFDLATYRSQVEWLLAETAKVEAGPISEASLARCRELYARMEQLRREFKEWEARHSP